MSRYGRAKYGSRKWGGDRDPRDAFIVPADSTAGAFDVSSNAAITVAQADETAGCFSPSSNSAIPLRPAGSPWRVFDVSVLQRIKGVKHVTALNVPQHLKGLVKAPAAPTHLTGPLEPVRLAGTVAAPQTTHVVGVERSTRLSGKLPPT